VELEITPEPSPEEKAAIVAALSKLRAVRVETPGPWWQAGIREAVDDDETAADEV
jgi:hypothetical protein